MTGKRYKEKRIPLIAVFFNTVFLFFVTLLPSALSFAVNFPSDGLSQALPAIVMAIASVLLFATHRMCAHEEDRWMKLRLHDLFTKKLYAELYMPMAGLICAIAGQFESCPYVWGSGGGNPQWSFIFFTIPIPCWFIVRLIKRNLWRCV